MGLIQPRKMDTSAEELVSLAGWLQNVHEQIERLGRDQSAFLRLSDQEYPAEEAGGVLMHLEAAQKILENEISAIQREAQILQQCALIYRKAQKRTCDIYSGEYVFTPRTEFGRSRFENLDTFRDLMSVLPDKKAEEGAWKDGSPHGDGTAEDPAGAPEAGGMSLPAGPEILGEIY